MKEDKQQQTERMIAKVKKYELQGNYYEASLACRQAFCLDKTDLSLLVWLGWILFKMERYEQALECSEFVKHADDAQFIPGSRLEVFACAALGRWSQAALVFENISLKSRDDCFSIAVESASTFKKYLYNKHSAGDFGEVIDLYSFLPRAIGSLKSDVTHEMALIAVSASVTLDKYELALSFADINLIKHTNLSQFITDENPFAGITLVTSIMPSRLEIQKLAVKSWIDLGAEVVSVNGSKETKYLESHFPSVEFVIAEVDAESQYGKPYIYMRHMLLALARAKNDIAGVINSDVVLRIDREIVLRNIRKEAVYSFIFGPRFDVKNIEQLNHSYEGTNEYRHGFD